MAERLFAGAEPAFGGFDAFAAGCFLTVSFLAETVDFGAVFFAGAVALAAASFAAFAATFVLAFGFAFAAVLTLVLAFGFALAAVFTFALVFGLGFGVAFVVVFVLVLAFALALGADVFFAAAFNFFACTFDVALDAVFDFAFCFGADFALALVLVVDFATDFFGGDLRFAAIDHPIRYATKSCSKSSSERYQNISHSPSGFLVNRASQGSQLFSHSRAWRASARDEEFL